MPEVFFEQFSKPDGDHFVVEGRWCVEALLDSDDFETVAVIRAEGSHEDFDAKYLHLTDVYILPKSRLAELLGFAFHRGIVALAKRPDPVRPDADVISGHLIACPELADESNLGAIVRTAAALGVSGILVPQNRGADVFSRKSIRVSSGAVFRIPVYECLNLIGEILNLKANGFTVVATDLEDESISLDEVPNFADGVVLFGPEQGGLTPEWLELCDLSVKIPMAGGIDSLNVAACAAIVLYQFSKGNRT